MSDIKYYSFAFRGNSREETISVTDLNITTITWRNYYESNPTYQFEYIGSESVTTKDIFQILATIKKLNEAFSLKVKLLDYGTNNPQQDAAAVLSIQICSTPKIWYGQTAKRCIDLIDPTAKQTAGIIPFDLSQDECNTTCYCIPVFASLTSNETKFNDFSSFLMTFPFGTPATFILQQKINNIWTTIVPNLTNTYGKLYAIGFIPNNPQTGGYMINWQTVLANFGQGTYRLFIDNIDVELQLFTPPFCLLDANCNNIESYAKIEYDINGKVTNHKYHSNLNEEQYFDFNGTTWKESIRWRSTFGNIQTQTQKTTLISAYDKNFTYEDRKTFTYEYELFDFPKELIERFAAYAMRANKVVCFDYSKKTGLFGQRIAIFDEEPNITQRIGNTIEKMTCKMISLHQNTYNEC